MVSPALPARVGRKEDMFGNGGDERLTRRCIGCDEKKKSWASRLTGHHPFVSMLHCLSRTARGELLRGLRLADCNLTFSLTAQDVLLGCQIHFSLSCSPPPFFSFFFVFFDFLFGRFVFGIHGSYWNSLSMQGKMTPGSVLALYLLL